MNNKDYLLLLLIIILIITIIIINRESEAFLDSMRKSNILKAVS